ncbi:MAG: CRISPR-associated helicase Cas3' [Planctomycetaceae bacterium]|nr:CRISPR-associated helicase Cas3' [Planctomycetaceae bacterium]
MSKEIYAHTSGHSQEDWQTLEDHQKKTACRASCFARHFDSSDWAWNAGFLHDLGKIAKEFQNKLRRAKGLECENETGSVNHSGAGAAFAEEKYGQRFGRTLAYLIAGHHAGLPDYMEGKGKSGTALRMRMKEAKEDLDKIRKDIDPFVTHLKKPLAFPAYVDPHNYHLWVRMLFSCMVDADWLDTESVMTPEKSKTRNENKSKFPSIDELTDKFWEHMKEKIAHSDQTSHLNGIRNEILEACRNAAQHDPGLFTLTVPTGGGKTLSSMAFALEHAKKHGKKRIIYVIPYTSIIEQTANIFRSVFGEANVVEHHSNISRDDDDEKNSEKQKQYLEMDMAAENWDAPIIVTTNVQFFESLYAAKPKRCRKLHNIVNSVVLIDEAQLISPEYLTPCVDVINELTQPLFGVSIVLCTATQPALPGLKLRDDSEIIPNPQQYYEALKRVDYHFPKNVEERTAWEELAENLKRHDEVLCVVNTRRDCRELYDLMRNEPENKGETVHLSALMCGEHRSEVIKKIKEHLENNRKLKEEGKPIEPLRVISTQLVEAGVDIDFPVVYRALAGLDSIVQAAGRCNREGKPELGNVHVFVPEKPAPPGLLRKGEVATRILIERHSSSGDFNNLLFQKVIFDEYFKSFYLKNDDMKRIAKQFRQWLTDKVDLDDCDDDDVYIEVAFRTVGNEFRLIKDDDSVPVIVRYKKNEEDTRIDEHIEQLQKPGGLDRDLLRKLQRYTVNIRKREFDGMKNALLEEIHGIWVQIPKVAKYSEIGLEMDPDIFFQ